MWELIQNLVIKKETEAIAMFAEKDWKLIQQQRRVERQTESVQNRGPLFSFKQSEEFEASGLGKNMTSQRKI